MNRWEEICERDISDDQRGEKEWKLTVDATKLLEDRRFLIRMMKVVINKSGERCNEVMFDACVNGVEPACYTATSEECNACLTKWACEDADKEYSAD